VLNLFVDGFPRKPENMKLFEKVFLDDESIFISGIFHLLCNKDKKIERCLKRNHGRSDDEPSSIIKRVSNWDDEAIVKMTNEIKKPVFQIDTNKPFDEVYSEVRDHVLKLSTLSSNNSLGEEEKKKKKIITSPTKEKLYQLIQDEEHMPSYIYSYPPKTSYISKQDSLQDLEIVNKEEKKSDFHSSPSKISSSTNNSLVAKGWADYSGPLNVYIHVPYCKMKCSFCNLFTTMSYNSEKGDEYTKNLLGEMKIFKTLAPSKNPIKTIHFGGGTPTLLSINCLKSILEELKNSFDTSKVEEIAIESTPSALSEEYLMGLKELGITRLSIGVQTFDYEELKVVGREKELGLNEKTVSLAQKIGFNNLNVDLIYGLPHQTNEVFIQNVKKAISMNVDTVTLYCLAIREKTTFGRMKRKLEDNSQSLSKYFKSTSECYNYYEEASELLKSNGFTHRTHVLFGKGNSQEEREFDGVPTLGFGAGARSYAKSIHYTSDHYFSKIPPHKIIKYYQHAIEKGEIPILSFTDLNKDEQIRRHVILNLLYFKGIDTMQYRYMFEEMIDERFKEVLRVLEEEGFIRYHEEDGVWKIVMTKEGMIYSSAIGQMFFSSDVIEARTQSGYK
jgi:oxygen-independent coproporphyrinogen-3 oxidase